MCHDRSLIARAVQLALSHMRLQVPAKNALLERMQRQEAFCACLAVGELSRGQGSQRVGFVLRENSHHPTLGIAVHV